MRNMSFSLTTAQVRAGTKTVTRRLGWLYLKPGDRLMACVKCMGRKPGEPLERIREIEIVSTRRELLGLMNKDSRYGFAECIKEGFPFPSVLSYPSQFVEFFCNSHGKCTPETVVTRIEFRYL